MVIGRPSFRATVVMVGSAVMWRLVLMVADLLCLRYVTFRSMTPAVSRVPSR